METNRLKQFCVIVETGSLTTAAGLLNVTHSSLSKSMKVLQQELKKDLFQPRGRGLSVTEQGFETYRSAKELLTTEHRLFSDSAPSSREFIRLGAPEVFLGGLVDAVATGIFEERAATLLDLEPGDLEKRISEGQLDFGATYAPYPSERIDISEIGRYRLGCYHLAGAFKGCSFNDLPFVVPTQGLSANPLGIKERDGWLESLHPRNKVFSTNLLNTALELTQSGACAIYIPSFVANRINAKGPAQLTEVPLPRDVKKSYHTAFAIRSAGRPEDREFKKFCSTIRKIIHTES